MCEHMSVYFNNLNTPTQVVKVTGDWLKGKHVNTASGMKTHGGDISYNLL